MAKRIPMVRPPRFASGGGAAPAFALSGAPAVPVPSSRRGQILALQYADDERGRFTERIFKVPPFPALAPGGSTVAAANAQRDCQMVSNRTSFVRLVAVRGVLKLSDTLPLNGFELANLLIQVQLNGEENLITSGNQSNPSSFDELFASASAPWFWFAAPPRLRVSDIINVIVTNDFATSTEISLTPAVSFRIVDDKWWQAMYGTVVLDEDEGGEE